MTQEHKLQSELAEGLAIQAIKAWIREVDGLERLIPDHISVEISNNLIKLTLYRQHDGLTIVFTGQTRKEIIDSLLSNKEKMKPIIQQAVGREWKKRGFKTDTLRRHTEIPEHNQVPFLDEEDGWGYQLPAGTSTTNQTGSGEVMIGNVSRD